MDSDDNTSFTQIWIDMDCCVKLVLIVQVTHQLLYTIQIVSKQLYGDKQDNNDSVMQTQFKIQFNNKQSISSENVFMLMAADGLEYVQYVFVIPLWCKY